MTERTKTLVWKKTQAHRDRFTRSMGREWKTALIDQLQPLLQEISVANLDGLVARVPQLILEDLIKEQLDRNVAVVGGYFAKTTFNSIQKAGAPMLIIKEGIPTDDQWKEFVSGRLGHLAGERITAITDSSREQAIKIIQAVLQEGVEEGMGTSQIAVLLRDILNKQWGEISTYRAARIARTETTMASNLGSLVGAEKTGEPMLKVWLSTRDSRTRRRKGKQKFDHYGKEPTGPDGEAQELDHQFKKTGESLDYPGDYAGSPGNVIQCRCTMFYEPKNID